MLHLWSSDGILADGSNHGRSFSLPPYDVGLLFPLQTSSRMGIVMEIVRSTFTVLLQKTSPKIKVFNDAVEAHSCIDPLMPNSFLSKTQLLMINQLQDVSTRRSLSTAYRMTKYSCTQLTKTFGSKRPAVDLSLTVVFCSRRNLAS